jgi:hypothetical protein
MRERVITDFMASLSNDSRDARMAEDIHSALKECGGNAVVMQVFDEREASFAWTIIERKGNGAALSAAAVDRRTEELR